jgi:queuine tRNA-ribosyltransferase
MRFTLETTDACGARAGVIETAHATLETPYFQPAATAGAVRGLTWRTMRELGYPHVLMNTYHLVLRPGVERIRAAGGMRAFSGWDGGILTDSGGYQVFSLAKLRNLDDDGVSFMSHIDGSMHRLTPESVIEAQAVFGSDIAMPLDICSPHDAEHERATRELELTTKWLREARDAWDRRDGMSVYGDEMSLFGIQQGALHKDLHEKSTADIAALDLPGYAVGGLSVGESDDDFVRLSRFCAQLLPEDKPRYLMGVGRPADLIRAIGWGYDLFDCVLPTRMARHNVAYTRRGNLDLRKAQYATDESPLDAECGCAVCRDHTRAYIYHLAKLHEMNAPILLSLHNLHFYRELMRAARAAIARRDYRAFARARLIELGEWNEKWDG